jgi:hypothetical protein
MLLVLLLVVGLTACGGNNTSGESGDAAQTDNVNDASNTEMVSTETDDTIIVVETSDGLTLKHLDGTDIATLEGYSYEDSSDGMISVRKDGRYGVVDMAGNVVVETEYEEEVVYSEGFAVVEKDGKYGYLDKTGAVAIDFQFEAADSFHSGLAGVEVNGVAGYIDTTGTIVIDPIYETALSFQSYGDKATEVTLVEKDGNWLYINKQGEEFTYAENAQPCIEGFDCAPVFYDGLSLAGEEGSYGYVDAEGNTVIEPQYYEASNFSEGLAAVLLNGYGYGFIDTSGNMVFESHFQNIRSFSEGLAAVCPAENNPERLWGYIDTAGNMVIEPQFDEAYDFSDGYAQVSLPGEDEVGFGYVDTEGNLVLQNELCEDCANHNGIAIGRLRGGSYYEGFVDVEKGEWIYETQFLCEAFDYEDGLAVVKTEDGEMGVLDVCNQTWILEPESNCNIEIVDKSVTYTRWG